MKFRCDIYLFICLCVWQKYNDFLETVHESISEFNVGENGGARWTHQEVLELVSGQALEVLTDGYEGTSMNLAQTIYSLAMHPDIQQKLHNEITENIARFGGISHQVMAELPYTEQVIKEALRLYPLLPRIDRECAQDVQYGNLLIKKGMKVSFPIYVIHRMQEYYDDPLTFNPDRFKMQKV